MAPSFTWGRANVTGIRRYNLSAPDDDNQAIWIKVGLTPRVHLSRSAMPSVTASRLVTDSFSDQINRGTLAYPSRYY